MKISPINYTYSAFKPAFKANNWSEKSNGNYLIHETAFFREPQTDEFVKNYLVENYLSKNKPVNIVVGACSTGEEVYSQAMLYDEYSHLVDILGFDLSPKAIELAQEGDFIIYQNIFNDKSDKDCWHKDSYLGFSHPRTKKQAQYANLFNDYFMDTTDIKKDFDPKIKGYSIFRGVKLFSLKKDKATNCTFRAGGTDQLPYFLEGKKANVIFFRNAMYHIACHFETRMMKSDAEERIRNIIRQMKENLAPNGLIVFGESEQKQGIDALKMYRIMQEEGFEPINADYRHEKLQKTTAPYNMPARYELANVWKFVG